MSLCQLPLDDRDADRRIVYSGGMSKALLGLFAAFFVLGCGSRSSAPIPATGIPTGTVTMEVDVDDQVDRFEFLDVASGTTLESLMRSIDDPPVKIQGSKTTAFVQSIGDKATSASEGWTFTVDGEFSNSGVGSTILEPPTTITWRFGDFSETTSAANSKSQSDGDFPPAD